MKKTPTFQQLCEQRELHVVNPDTGKRFVISLRDWCQCLWGVRVIPDVWEPSDQLNSFCQRQHLMLPRSAIEEWLGRLQLAKSRSRKASVKES